MDENLNSQASLSTSFWSSSKDFVFSFAIVRMDSLQFMAGSKPRLTMLMPSSSNVALALAASSTLGLFRGISPAKRPTGHQ
jgi:hypothetical protein